MKKTVCLLLALLMLAGMLPALRTDSAAAGQVYYPVNFSDAMVSSGIGQKNSTDCALVSVATIEAYSYGAVSSADKTTVYKTVVNNNLGTTSGVPRDNAVQNWGKLGYTQMSSHSLASIYNEIAQGNPVIIHRSSGHWGIVCGYTGSTSTLEKSGFLVANPQRNPSKVTKQTLSTWLGSATLDNAYKRRSGIAVTGLGGIRIAANYPEIVHIKGQGHGVYGRVTSDANLTNVTVRVTNYDTDAVVYTKSVNPASKNCTLVDTFDSGMKFAEWGVGRYLYHISATDANKQTKDFWKYFTIASSYPAEAPKSPIYNAAFTWNDSLTNYLHGTDYKSVPYGVKSRDTSVATLSVDESVKHNEYNSLKIVNTSAGASGKDLEIPTQTNNRVAAGWVGDEKEMVLSFWAKGTVNGAKMYFRWGFETSYRSVTLSTDWKQYTVRMDKVPSYGNAIHPYVDKAGTVWITEMQLEDGTTPTTFRPDKQAVYSNTAEIYGKNYILPKDPSIAVYEFDGWYTSKKGGTRVTENTVFPEGNIRLYAHWRLKLLFIGFDLPLPDVGGGCYDFFPFVDVPESKYYYEPVLWAYYHNPRVTSGADATHFSPNKTCTREQIMTFIWKANNAPEPTLTECDFTDVNPNKYYYDAILWALEHKLTGGVGGGKFGVGKPCTREQVVTFLWKAAGSPEPETTECAFTDVNPKKYYYKAILWAVENKVTGGMGGGKFGVGKTCTRAQVVTFLYAAAARQAEQVEP